MTVEAPEGWISDAELQSQLEAFGLTSIDRKLERWRSEGLMLPRPMQISNYHGSQIWHPPSAPRQAQAIARALAAKSNYEWVGEVLWAAGFEVDERYWRPQLRSADQLMQQVAVTVRGLINREDDSLTIGDEVAALDRFTGVVAKIARRLPAEQFARVVNVGAEVIAGDFPGFDEAASDRDEFTTESATQEAMDLVRGADDQIWANRLTLSASLANVLAEMSSAQSENPQEFSDSEIQNARDDVRNALKISVCLYEALSWIYGPQAFGLRMAAFIGRTAPKNAIFGFSLGFARLRRRSNQFHSTVDLAELADRAEKVWLMSEYFRTLQDECAELRNLVGPKRLKAAFSDSREYGKLLKELAGYEFPKPAFRPWDQWQKLSKKTISPGLLAMSIGALSQIDIANIIPSEIAVANP